MTSTLLLGACVCGEPLFRHRTIEGRQIACAAVRRIDQDLHANNQLAQQTLSTLHVVARHGELVRQGGVR